MLSMGAYRDFLGFSYPEKGNKTVNVFFAGCGVLIKRNVLEEVGGYDESFFIIHEDVDLCWRFWLRGYKTIGVPKSIVYHEALATRRKLGSSISSFFSARNRLIANIKNYELKNLFFYNTIIYSLYFGYAAYTCFKGNALVGKAYLKAILLVLIHFPSIWRRRLAVQSTRKYSDTYLKRLKLMCKPQIAHLLEHDEI
jgi:hypothetical protein